MTSTPAAIAARLARLTDVMHPRDRGPYTDTELAQAVTAGDTFGDRPAAPVPLTVADLAALRAGRPTGRTSDQLAAVTNFYGVTGAYFTDDSKATQVDQKLRLLELMRDTDVRHIGLCHGDTLSVPGLIAILEAAQHAGAGAAEHVESDDD